MHHVTLFFLRNKKFTWVLTLFVIIFGLGGLARVNNESFPAVDFAMATVTTIYDGASAEDIETKITKPIEEELRGVSGIKDVRSVSQPGLSTIFIRGDIDNVNVPRLMADLQRAVDRAEMPNDLEDPPKFVEMKSEEFPVIELAVVGDNTDRNRDRIADLLREEIEDLTEIKEVRTVGYRERAFEIWLDRAKLERHHVGVNEVTRALEIRNVNTPGGHLENPPRQQLLRIEGKVTSRAELENVLIRSNSAGQQIYLKDIAKVVDGQQEARVLSRHNGEAATLLIATKKAGADTLELVGQIDEKLKVFRDKYAGKLKFEIFNNEALRVKNRVEVLYGNAWSGLALVVLFLFIFLPGRIGFMASFSLPIAIMATVGFMPIFGMNIDAITILALVIALGMMVDNSVVVSENYTRLRSEGLASQEALLTTVKSLWLPVFGTAATTIASFMPMLATTGIMGQFIRFIPILVSISLVVCLAECFILLPTRLDGIAAKTTTVQDDWFQRRVVPWFERLVARAVRHRYITALLFTGLILFSFVMMFGFNRFILFPPDQTEIYAARLSMPIGTTLDTTDAELQRLSQGIHEKLGTQVEHIVARAGISTMGPGDPKAKESDNVGIIMIYVTTETRNTVSHLTILESLRSLPASNDADVIYEAMINGPPVGEPINATFRSNDSASLDAVVQGIVGKLKETPGVRDVSIEDTFGDSEVHVVMDYAKAALLGLDVDSVGKAIRTAISGKIVSDVNLINKEVDLVLRFAAPFRRNIDDLKNLKVLGRDGFLIPLSAFATFHEAPPTALIKRFQYKRARTVTANIDDKVITAIKANQVVKDAYAKLNDTYKEVSLVFGGEEESTKESMDSLWNALILSLIGIFAILVFLFNSYLRPLVIMTTTPLGLVGFSIAFALHQRPISFLAMIGIIGLGGIIVNSGIVLISFIDELRASGMPLEQALAKASGMRLRAVVVSAMTTIMGLLPTAYGIGGTDALLVPMTLALAWGLTSATLLTLIWVPPAYGMVEDFTKFSANIFKRRTRPPA